TDEGGRQQMKRNRQNDRPSGSKQKEPLAALLDLLKDGVALYKHTHAGFDKLQRKLISTACQKAEQLLNDGDILEAAKYLDAVHTLHNRTFETAAKAAPYVHPRISPKPATLDDSVPGVIVVPQVCETVEEWYQRCVPHMAAKKADEPKR